MPARYAGRRLQVRLGARTVEVLAGGAVVARHERAWHKNTEVLVLDHYLEVLSHKPGALAGATALVQARASGGFTAAHDAWWALARRKLGEAAGTRALVEVLLAYRGLPAAAIVAALTSAVRAGLTDAAAVIIEARRHADRRQGLAEVVPIGTLAGYDRPAPTLDGYDQLLEAAR